MRTLDDLEPGNVVIFSASKGPNHTTFERLESVERITPRTIITDGGRYEKDGGREIGGLPGRSIAPATPEDIERIRERVAKASRRSEESARQAEEEDDRQAEILSPLLENFQVTLQRNYPHADYDLTFYGMSEKRIRAIVAALSK